MRCVSFEVQHWRNSGDVLADCLSMGIRLGGKSNICVRAWFSYTLVYKISKLIEWIISIFIFICMAFILSYCHIRHFKSIFFPLIFQLHFLNRTNYDQQVPQLECNEHRWNWNHDWNHDWIRGLNNEENTDVFRVLVKRHYQIVFGIFANFLSFYEQTGSLASLLPKHFKRKHLLENCLI